MVRHAHARSASVEVSIGDDLVRVTVSDDGRGFPRRAEGEELRRLREENRRLKMERDIVKKATACFAKESS